MAKIYLERMVGKYMVNLHLNKTICTYIINNYCSEAPNNSVPEVFGSKKYFTKLLHVCNRAECVVVSMLEFTVNEATTSSYLDVWMVKEK